MSSDNVQHYLWRDYGLAFHKSWILTLTDTEALALYSFVTTLVAYTQSRVWHIERKIFNRLTAPEVQLPIDDKREELSQGAAIGILVRAVQRRRRTHLHAEEIRPIKPWIGIIAIVNIVGFVILGVVLPWSLSGGIESPLVVARDTDECMIYQPMPEAEDENILLADRTFKQCWRDRRNIPNSCSRREGILSERPEFVLSHEDTCPFRGVCKANFGTVSLGYNHLSLRDFGVHSKSTVMISHRLSCSPLETEKFLIVPPDSRCEESMVSFSNRKESPFEESVNEFKAKLMSCNGPNKFSSQPSGKMSIKNSCLNHSSLPEMRLNVWGVPQLFDPAAARKFDPALWRSDGKVFVVGFRPGLTWYPATLDDPMMSAHDPLDNAVDLLGWCNWGYYGDKSDLEADNEKSDEAPDMDYPLNEFYLPDQEMTALGCLEQFKLCLRQTPMFCTPWGSGEDTFTVIAEMFQRTKDSDSLSDLEGLVRVIIVNATVGEYLLAFQGQHKGLQDILPLTDMLENPTRINRKEQWIEELQAWFETTLLYRRHTMSSMLPQNPPRDFRSSFDRKYNKHCSRILFFEADYTNFDFIQLLTIICCLISLCGLSFHRQVTFAGKSLGQVCWPYLIRAGRTTRNALRTVIQYFWPPRQENKQGEIPPPQPQRYPRNPFGDPRHRLNSEVYDMGQLSTSPAYS